MVGGGVWSGTVGGGVPVPLSEGGVVGVGWVLVGSGLGGSVLVGLVLVGSGVLRVDVGDAVSGVLAPAGPEDGVAEPVPCSTGGAVGEDDPPGSSVGLASPAGPVTRADGWSVTGLVETLAQYGSTRLAP